MTEEQKAYAQIARHFKSLARALDEAGKHAHGAADAFREFAAVAPILEANGDGGDGGDGGQGGDGGSGTSDPPPFTGG